MKEKNESIRRPTADGESTGTICVFLASVFFSIGGLCVKLIPWSALAINGARNLIGAAVIGVFLLVTGHQSG